MEVLPAAVVNFCTAATSEMALIRDTNMPFAPEFLCFFLPRVRVLALEDYSDSQCTVAPREFVFMGWKQEVDSLSAQSCKSRRCVLTFERNGATFLDKFTQSLRMKEHVGVIE